MSRAYLLKFSCHQKHLSVYVPSIMAATKSSHRPPEKRIRNSQPTNLLRATACYFHHILIIGAIRNIVGGGVGDSSNHINSTRKINVRETNLKCLCDFYHFSHSDDKSRDKQEINQHERVRNKLFLQYIYYLTDDGLLQKNI